MKTNPKQCLDIQGSCYMARQRKKIARLLGNLHFCSTPLKLLWTSAKFSQWSNMPQIFSTVLARRASNRRNLLARQENILQSTLSKRTLSKPDSNFGPLPAELHLYLCNWTLSKVDTSLNRTVALVPRVSALERVDCSLRLSGMVFVKTCC